MQFSATILSGVFTLFTLGSAFEMAAGAIPGRYSVKLSVNGTVIGEPILVEAIDFNNLPTTLTRASRMRRQVLPNPQPHCSGRSLNPSDFSSVKSAMDNWCDGGNQIGSSKSEFWYYQSAMAYMCNYSGNSQGCRSTEYDTASTLVDVSCGANTAGWVGISDWAKSFGKDQSGFTQC